MHTSVLLHECIESLNLKKGDVVVDGTFGAGGHSKALLEKEGSIRLIAIDVDSSALQRGEALVSKYPQLSLHHHNFADVSEVLAEANVTMVDKVLLDLGWSSIQLEEGNRGLSFMKDEPLLMTLRDEVRDTDTTAYTIINEWSEQVIADVLYGFGEERYARRIARAIVSLREVKPILTTFELVDIIRGAVPKTYRFGKIHPATRTFQALRIAVNKELEVLEQALDLWWKVLKPGGRIAIISFHSLEDRIVKRFFKARVELGEGELVTKKPITPSETELSENPRARSSKLRIIIKK